MYNLLKLIRYLVFVVFIVSNAIVTAVAVWNLSIVQGNMLFSSAAPATASYLIAVATMGLLLIFPIVFVEIAGKRIFLVKVWFELAWVGISGLMTLIGAALITNLSSRELCVPTDTEERLLVTSAILVSPCSSGQVLGVFTWMPAAFLLAYMSFLAIVAFVWSKEDPAVWKSLVRDLPLDKILGHVKRNSVVVTLPQIRKSPVIHAPRPRYIIPPLLDCRSARNSAYDGQSSAMPAKSAPVREMKMASTHLPSVSQGPYTSAATAFYNPSVQKAMVSAGGSRGPAPPRPPPPPPAAQLSSRRREQTSPPPLGDWPRLDATSQPRTKRYRAAPSQGRTHAVLGGTSDARRQSSRHAASGPNDGSGTTGVSPRTSPTRTRPPPGSGSSLDSNRSGFGSSHRPPPLDLSQISAHRTRSQRSRARAGR